MKTVYVVTWLDFSMCGDYDPPDVVVEGVYSSLEQANAIASKFYTSAVHGIGYEE